MAIDTDLITRSTIHAVSLSIVSNVLAQLISCYRRNLPYGIDIPRLVRFITFTSLNTPPNIYWQAWLENTFPRFTSQPTQSPATQSTPEDTKGEAVSSALATDASVQRRTAADKAHASPVGADDRTPQAQDQPKLNIRNTIIKFLLDQTLGAAINTLLFIAGVDLLQGQSWAYIKADIATNFWPIISAGQKIWPLVSVLQFTVVPLKHRALVGGIVGIFWGTILNLMK